MFHKIVIIFLFLKEVFYSLYFFLKFVYKIRNDFNINLQFLFFASLHKIFIQLHFLHIQCFSYEATADLRPCIFNQLYFHFYKSLESVLLSYIMNKLNPFSHTVFLCKNDSIKFRVDSSRPSCIIQFMNLNFYSIVKFMAKLSNFLSSEFKWFNERE